MSFNYIVDQLLDEHSFADTTPHHTTTKQPNLSTSLVALKDQQPTWYLNQDCT
jgi:hypothetical protein